VGVQLTVSGSEDDVFVATRDLLRNSSEMLSRYNDIKRAHKNDGETYRASKAVFFKKLLTDKKEHEARTDRRHPSR
jgi:GrpB-like predicted nucleotidyltransferase (UPF0157 family)